MGRYSEEKYSEVEYVEHLADQLDGVNWKELTSTARLVFFQVRKCLVH